MPATSAAPHPVSRGRTGVSLKRLAPRDRRKSAEPPRLEHLQDAERRVGVPGAAAGGGGPARAEASTTRYEGRDAAYKPGGRRRRADRRGPAAARRRREGVAPRERAAQRSASEAPPRAAAAAARRAARRAAPARSRTGARGRRRQNGAGGPRGEPAPAAADAARGGAPAPRGGICCIGIGIIGMGIIPGGPKPARRHHWHRHRHRRRRGRRRRAAPLPRQARGRRRRRRRRRPRPRSPSAEKPRGPRAPRPRAPRRLDENPRRRLVSASKVVDHNGGAAQPACRRVACRTSNGARTSRTWPRSGTPSGHGRRRRRPAASTKPRGQRTQRTASPSRSSSTRRTRRTRARRTSTRRCSVRTSCSATRAAGRGALRGLFERLVDLAGGEHLAALTAQGAHVQRIWSACVLTQAAWKSLPHLQQRTLASPTQETSHSGQMPATMRYGVASLEGAANSCGWRLRAQGLAHSCLDLCGAARPDPAPHKRSPRLARAAETLAGMPSVLQALK